MELAGRTALVTGASSGIGAAIAEGLAARGMTVGICARRADRLAEVLERCQQHAPDSRMWVMDLSQLDDLPTFAMHADDELGGIDLLVNNAGIPKRRLATALRWDEIDHVMAVNYLSPVRLTLTLLPRMLERGRGAIYNIGSVAARMSPAGETAYSASKAALTAFAEGLAIELWDTEVTVHVLHPGIIETELFIHPDNDESYADDVEPLPPSAVVDTLVAQVETGQFEAYLPEWFADVASGKAANLQGYLAGAAEYWRIKRAERGEAV
ncbi:MAG: SDR family oxidoreductase [Acidimicrobiales bacterium]|nr:SDR family oxidoreductase [Acidimicrobiales bacterium]